jgi:iron only hydrogenase large subunit-like protein
VIAIKTFQELYLEILEQEMKSGSYQVENYNPQHLDCLLNPDKYSAVVKTEHCGACANDSACARSCLFDAIEEVDGVLKINKEKCEACGHCLKACQEGHINATKDTFQVLKAIRDKEKHVYALVAPAFVGQFEGIDSAGKLRSALKSLGFKGLIAVAAFADILTLKEALEFNENINSLSDFQLTSCCCPIWISMVRREMADKLSHLPGSVSPMVAAGRVVKKIYPEAVTVFIGPCMAKKKEAKEPDIAGAIDHVLTFSEVNDIFKAAELDLAKLPDDERDVASYAGRIYARTGGVSEAVKMTVEKLNPHREIQLKAEQADGVAACKKLLTELTGGAITANFFEGMGCNGGCVGGPKNLIPMEEGKKAVNTYAEKSKYETPLNNPYITELLAKLGFDTIESLLQESDFFTRSFE